METGAIQRKFEKMFKGNVNGALFVLHLSKVAITYFTSKKKEATEEIERAYGDRIRKTVEGVAETGEPMTITLVQTDVYKLELDVRQGNKTLDKEVLLSLLCKKGQLTPSFVQECYDAATLPSSPRKEYKVTSIQK